MLLLSFWVIILSGLGLVNNSHNPWGALYLLPSIYMCVSLYKVVQIWPGQTVTCLHTNRPGHIWTTLYLNVELPILSEPLSSWYTPKVGLRFKTANILWGANTSTIIFRVCFYRFSFKHGRWTNYSLTPGLCLKHGSTMGTGIGSRFNFSVFKCGSWRIRNLLHLSKLWSF